MGRLRSCGTGLGKGPGTPGGREQFCCGEGVAGKLLREGIAEVVFVKDRGTVGWGSRPGSGTKAGRRWPPGAGWGGQGRSELEERFQVRVRRRWGGASREEVKAIFFWEGLAGGGGRWR